MIVFVFEDSKSGLKAGRNAGMKVVGITTANPASVVAAMADMVIDDYAAITVAQLAKLFYK
ncbi:hypothetical protein FPZ43_13005 [Mucilaginibacter pallidiroseus]|uniref:Beta-phosphoglucomutase n=1 Tax=Mucilaginibacter pallidiroseus TaxID=2599295 RepID=A0A563U7T4_9SPHI|nr:hypothetical protein [Mucilaginibacter pallidiroseus]TWR27396.1 hypothetical protein FPZ43_13005 [Mucilaginibacter pallidiroseus]